MKTIKEIAEHYGVTTMAVRHWIKEGKLPTKKEKVVGVKARYVLDIKDVERYLKSKEK